jgi:alkylation response protein AidB-like acyl-CoA dehydrogenase
MDFSWSSEQREWYDTIRTFSERKLNHTIQQRDREHRFGAEEWRLCGEFGLLGLPVPEKYGGLGLDALTTAYAVEAFGRGCEDAGLVFSACAHQFACLMPIAEHGSEELKQSLLPKLARGEWVGANGITESESGTDAFSLRTRAVADGDDYVISGEKSFVTNGPIADYILVYGSTNPKHGYMGLSAFIVHKDTPGLSVGQPFTKLGLATSPMSTVYLDNCRVPKRNRVGEEGQGANVFKSSMNWERACLFGAWVGVMDRQLERCISYARERKQFGKPIARYQSISHKIADMKLRLDAARLLLYRACWLKDQGQDSVVEVALSKLAVSEGVVQSSLDAIQIHGALGVVEEGGIERALRDSISSTIYSGTSEIQRELVAQGIGLSGSRT